ncbi:PAS domain-containing protein [Streptomyces nodosus]
MDHGTDKGAPFASPAGDGPAEDAPPGRVPLATVVVDRDRLVSHWSPRAGRLFGVPGEDAIGRPAADLLPVSGTLPEDEESGPLEAPEAHDGPGPGRAPSSGGRLPHPAAGRARLSAPGGARGVPDGERVDVLWWAYPLTGPGPERLLVLAAEVGALHRDEGVAAGRIAPGFALHTDVPDAEELARGLPGTLPGMSVGESARIAAHVLELGYPMVDFGRSDRVPVTPDWSTPRRGACRSRTARAEAPGRPAPEALRDGDADRPGTAARERLGCR